MGYLVPTINSFGLPNKLTIVRYTIINYMVYMATFNLVAPKPFNSNGCGGARGCKEGYKVDLDKQLAQ